MKMVEPQNPLYDLYDHWPVDITTFLDDPSYMNLKDEVWPEVRQNLIELFDRDPLDKKMSSHDEFVFKAGIGSGKSYLISLLFCYVLYRLLCYKNPQSIYDLANGTMMVLLNMSKNAMQARKVVFGEIKARIEYSPWFNQYCLPDPDVKSELRFDKHINILPGNSEETYPLGFAVFAGNIDEAAFFTETQDHDVAEEIFYALKRRMDSRFEGCGMLGITSSPRYVDDFIERKIKEADTAKHIKAKVIETWNSKPNDLDAIKRGEFFEAIHPTTGELTRIPLRYQYDFQKNPEKAWRDFGAVPSLVLEPYLKHFEMVTKCVDMAKQNPVDALGKILDSFKPNSYLYYFMHIDLALRKDAAGIAMAHKENDMVIVDLIHRIAPKPGMEIDIGAIRDFVIALSMKGFRLGKVTYDQFQSASSIQELNRRGIPSENLSVDANLIPYETFKELCYSTKVKFPFHEFLMTELKRLELIQGKKVDHPAKGSKDVADAVVGAVYNTVIESEKLRPITVKIL